MGYTNNILKRYGKDLEDLYGGLEDWKVVKNYNELMGIFEKKRADKDSYNKFKQINQNLTRAGSLLTNNDFLTEKEEFDSNNPDLLNTDAYKRYETFKTMNSKPDANFSDFMKEDGLSRKELMDKGYLKINKVPLDEESQKSLLFTKAGLSPEDQQFYEEYKKAGGFDKAGQYNEDLMNLVYDNIPGLTSQRGKMGDVYLKSALMKAQQMGIKPDAKREKPEYFKMGEDLYTVDEFGQPRKVIEGEKKPGKSLEDNPNNWFIDEVDGKLVWMVDAKDPETGQWGVKPVRELTPKEAEDYRQGLIDEQTKKSGKKGGTGKKGGIKMPALDPVDPFNPEGDGETPDASGVDVLPESVNKTIKNRKTTLKVLDKIKKNPELEDMRNSLYDEVAKGVNAINNSKDIKSAQKILDGIYKFLGDNFNDMDEDIRQELYDYVDDLAIQLYQKFQ